MCYEEGSGSLVYPVSNHPKARGMYATHGPPEQQHKRLRVFMPNTTGKNNKEQTREREREELR